MMKLMPEVAVALALISLVGGVFSHCASAQEREGYEQILKSRNGRYTKQGWNHYGPGYFELDRETGVLTSHGGMGLFWYAAKQYGDFVLELEFRCAGQATNSGVFLRVPGIPTSDDYIYHSFEIQINDAGEGIHMTGAVYDGEAPTELASRPTGEWNHYKITFVGNHITVELNGKLVIDWEAEPRGKVEDIAQRGYIGLQNHDDRSAVYFRNIYVKELR
ncbi:MAG: DUF1080 domain-containing protein [Gemmatimonadales bacterium]|nr:DUF1080 domain-containing protein [Gemmatimonadales bacterium]NIN10192.1 DUF1080 domain-containing protein [Gemmatimonadales bacterium]NIN48948.1 DUF1080 domain-containing protein [Gemmatimonadales bacterium]NIP06412.1 DUF1080 domain-containing protein [Gemmatimonadales bacterium]NIS63637.1 DUF1080 domain-containing protein [Gemmatimonadales bacterium]